MTSALDGLIQLLISERAIDIFQALCILVVGFFVAKVATRTAVSFFEKRFDTHELYLLRRVVSYGILSLFVISALHQMGFNLSVVLGAAGIFSVALGFASQTSASNLISGLFLIGERAFMVGDVIKVGATTGEVLSIDLLSVKLRTFDNLHVRIPNESLIKSEVTTLTKFPIRRVDLQIGVAYKEDLTTVRDLLLALAQKNPLCLENPQPLFIFTGFGASSMDLQLSIWCKRQNFLDLKNSLQIEIKEAFDCAGIEIPFPHMTLYKGSQTEPFPVAYAAGEDVQVKRSGERAMNPDEGH